MDQGWAAIVAAIAAGFFGITGVFAGIVVGRRQTVDQAAVEHGQWLRGQRQEAYIKFLEAWEQALADFEQFEHQPEAWFRVPPNADPEPYYAQFDEAVTRPISRLRPFLERVTILGTTEVEAAAVALNKVLTDLRDVLWRGFDSDGPSWVAYRRVLERSDDQRRLFVKRAREVMLTAPRPGAE
ncbi:hypothetical protein [Streptomyces sp. NPDC007991]|uniref:hypothetical protein n=1 Tax=Streptomyces sp. NPDC007991 TaxID=3364803 RepID=UPI0036E08F31